MSDEIPAPQVSEVTRLQLEAERDALETQGTDDQRRAAEKRAAAWGDSPKAEPRSEPPATPKAKAERHTRRTT